MKVFKKILLALSFMLMFTVTVAMEEKREYEGTLNPFVIVEKWVQTGKEVFITSDVGLRKYQNPEGGDPMYVQLFVLYTAQINENSEISLIAELFAYRYFMALEPYVYMWNIDKNVYAFHPLSEEDRIKCISCHAEHHPDFREMLKQLNN